MNNFFLHLAGWAIAVFIGALIGELLIGRTHDSKIRGARAVLGSFLVFAGLVISDRVVGGMISSYLCWAAGVALTTSARRPDTDEMADDNQ
jgi:sugar phosphate permease